MNERIRELYRQAHSVRHYDSDPALDGNPPTVYWQSEVSAQRFAELIVRECAKVAGQEQVYNERHEIPVDIEQSVLEHFGVE